MPRQNERVALDMYCNKMINGVPFLTRTKDLSRQGVYVHQLLEPSAPEGAHLALEFVLPGQKEVIWAEADVAHLGDGGTGLRFRHLTPRQSRMIDEFIAAAS